MYKILKHFFIIILFSKYSNKIYSQEFTNLDKQYVWLGIKPPTILGMLPPKITITSLIYFNKKKTYQITGYYDNLFCWKDTCTFAEIKITSRLNQIRILKPDSNGVFCIISDGLDEIKFVGERDLFLRIDTTNKYPYDYSFNTCY